MDKTDFSEISGAPRALDSLPKDRRHTAEDGDFLPGKPVRQGSQTLFVKIRGDQGRAIEQRQIGISRCPDVMRTQQADPVLGADLQGMGLGANAEQLTAVIPNNAFGFASGAGREIDIGDRVRRCRYAEIVRSKMRVQLVDVQDMGVPGNPGGSGEVLIVGQYQRTREAVDNLPRFRFGLLRVHRRVSTTGLQHGQTGDNGRHCVAKKQCQRPGAPPATIDHRPADSVCRSIQFVIGQCAIRALDGGMIRMPLCLLLEAFGDRLIDVCQFKLDEWAMAVHD